MTDLTTGDLAKADEQNAPIDAVHGENARDAAPLPETMPGERYQREPWPRAKPHEWLTRGMRPEDFFGMCAEEFDDEFMDSLRAIRREVLSTEQRS